MHLFFALSHLFIPKESNNHRAKLLHSHSILILALFFVITFQILPRHQKGQVLGYASQISVDEVIRLTNEKRKDIGLSALNQNSLLTQAALDKGKHMIDNGYWAHTAPDGTEPWAFFKTAGYKYRYAGENLARDFPDARSAVDAWMASPTHKENLLSPKYQEIGIAVVEGDLGGKDATIIVQLFGAQAAGTPIAPRVAASETNNKPEEKAAAQQSETSTAQKLLPATFNSQTNVGSVFNFGRVLSLSIIFLLSMVMVIDLIIANSKGVVRYHGRTFAHLSFFGIVFAIVLIIRAGQIL